MNMRHILFTASLIVPLVLTAPNVAAAEEHDHHHDEHHQHGAHVHGLAALNLALEGREVHIELDSPAANIVGFEHAPASESDHAALDQAVAVLKDGDRLFRFNDEAGCRMENAKVSSELLEEEHEKHEHEGHAEEHADEQHEHEHEEGGTHSDIEVAYHFECSAPGALKQLTVELFKAFPGMHELEVQYVIESKQGAAELTARNHLVKF